VVEKLSELRQIISTSKQIGVEPLIGIRARLLSKGAGKWAESGGENAKFGLSTAELLAATDLMQREGLAHCFKLVHFHIGSQVPDILTVKKAVQEAARYYAKLSKMGFGLEFIDVGGGLGVDYDGSRSAFESSTNYTLQEYTNDVVYYIADVCNAENVPHPNIVSESGRAIVAHHSVLIVEVFGAIEKSPPGISFDYGEKEHAIVRELLDIRKNLAKLNKLEAYHDALERREDAHNMFTFGMMDLPDKELQRPGVHPGGDSQTRGQPGRPIPVQLFRVPIAARSLGTGAALPDHAGAAIARAADARRHARGHHVRLGRADQQVHRSSRRARHLANA
jgi:arginine decarboxylase